MSTSTRDSLPPAKHKDHPEPDHLLAYLRQELSRDETEVLRDHLTECAECRQLLLEAVEFAPQQDPEVSASRRQAAWNRLQNRRSSATPIAEHFASVEPFEAPLTRPPRRALARIAALWVLILGAGALVTHQFRTQHGKLAEQTARLDEQKLTLTALGHALEQAERDRDAALRRLAEGVDSDPPAHSAGPRIETSVAALDLVPGNFLRDAGAQRPQVSRGVHLVYVNFHLPPGAGFKEYRLEIVDPSHRTVQSVSGLTTTPLGTIAMVIPAATMPTGINELRLQGLGAGSPQTVERYEVEVVEP